MTTLIELAERCEKLAGPCRETDAGIWLATTPGATRRKSSYVHKATGRTCDVDETRAPGGLLIVVPSYTGSLDAALSLIPAGWTRAVDATAPEAGIDVDLYAPDDFSEPVKGTHPSSLVWDSKPVAASEYLATCAAALRARAAIASAKEQQS